MSPLLYSKYFGIHYRITRTQNPLASLAGLGLGTRLPLHTTRPLPHWSRGAVSSHMNTNTFTGSSRRSRCHLARRLIDDKYFLIHRRGHSLASHSEHRHCLRRAWASENTPWAPWTSRFVPGINSR